jgi:Nitrate/nitrite transporter
MDKKMKKINQLFPWYSGLSSDLIFYIAINTIWLTTIKGFSPAQITFLSTISSLFGIVFQIPLLKIIKRVGNTKSIRIGALCMLIASIMLTFCTNYISFAIANIFLEISLVFEMMSAILIKNNLEYQNKSSEYIKIRSKSSMIYAISTAIVALFIGAIFNIHQYLPMILGIIICVFCFISSLFIFDADEIDNNKISEKSFKQNLVIPKPIKLFLLLLLFYGLSFGIVVISQQNSKLLIQYELSKFLAIENVATYLGIILFVSRMARVITNYFFPKIYNKVKNRISIILVISLLLSSSLLLIGFYLNVNHYLKVAIMTIGFSLLPSLRDPIKIYTQNLILETYDKAVQKDTMVYLSLARHIGKFLLSLLASFVLLKLPIQNLFLVFLVITLPLIIISTGVLKSIKELSKTK